MNDQLARLVFALGVRAKNARIPERFRFLNESESWSRERLLEYQSNALAQLVQRAKETSPFYARRFAEAGIDTKRVRTIEDLQALPIVSKTELVDNGAEIQSIVPGQKQVPSWTSGSSGLSLRFVRNQDWDAWHNAAVMRGYRWHGARLSDRKGYLWGYNLDPGEYTKAKRLDALQNRFRMFSYSEQEMENFAKQLRGATCLDGYSSMIYEVARYLETRPDLSKDIDLKLVKGTSEKILDVYQEKARAVFGRSIVSEYGSAEGGIIAFECERGKMHITMETVIVEVVEGRTIISNLVSDSFPVIRYDLGDAIEVDFDERCSCGREGYVIKEVVGRVGRYIVGNSQRYPSMTLYALFKSLNRDGRLSCGFQGFQERPGHMTLRLDRHLDVAEREALLKETSRYFTDDLEIDLEEGVVLVSGKAKKQDFVTTLSPDLEPSRRES